MATTISYTPKQVNRAKAIALHTPNHHMLVDLDSNGNVQHLYDMGRYLKEHMSQGGSWHRQGIPHPLKTGKTIPAKRAMKIMEQYYKHGGRIDAKTMASYRKQLRFGSSKATVTVAARSWRRSGKRLPVAPVKKSVSTKGGADRKDRPSRMGDGILRAGKRVASAGSKAGESVTGEQMLAGFGTFIVSMVGLAVVGSATRLIRSV
jgi:hypothetical protein